MPRLIVSLCALTGAKGLTALAWAAYQKRPNHLRLLLEHGAREDIADANGKVRCVSGGLDPALMSLGKTDTASLRRTGWQPYVQQAAPVKSQYGPHQQA